jgi:hypothetical protein
MAAGGSPGVLQPPLGEAGDRAPDTLAG